MNVNAPENLTELMRTVAGVKEELWSSIIELAKSVEEFHQIAPKTPTPARTLLLAYHLRDLLERKRSICKFIENAYALAGKPSPVVGFYEQLNLIQRLLDSAVGSVEVEIVVEDKEDIPPVYVEPTPITGEYVEGSDALHFLSVLEPRRFAEEYTLKNLTVVQVTDNPHWEVLTNAYKNLPGYAFKYLEAENEVLLLKGNPQDADSNYIRIGKITQVPETGAFALWVEGYSVVKSVFLTFNATKKKERSDMKAISADNPTPV